MQFRKIGLAVAFSPRAEAMLAEAVRLASTFNAELILIHVSREGEEAQAKMKSLLQTQNLTTDHVTVCWRKGRASDEILRACREYDIDLLITGALKKEDLVKYYVGSVARKILRKSNCSVLTLINPHTSPTPFESIVVEADEPSDKYTVTTACRIGTAEKVRWLHIVKEIKLYGLTMSSAAQGPEEEYLRTKAELIDDEVDKIQRLLSQIPHEGLKINIKVLPGKAGFEIAQFAKRKAADLLVIGAPPRRLSLLDRLFPHDVEYIFADLPCNLLVVHPSKKAAEVSHA